MSERDQKQTTQETRESAPETSARGTDDRRGTVRPEDRPVPTSPEPDSEAVEKGEEILGRVKPY